MSIGPATGGGDITPSDNNDLEHVPRGIWVGGEGAVRLTTYDGDDVTIKSIQAGTLLPVYARKVWATGTTAADLVGLW